MEDVAEKTRQRNIPLKIFPLAIVVLQEMVQNNNKRTKGLYTTLHWHLYCGDSKGLIPIITSPGPTGVASSSRSKQIPLQRAKWYHYYYSLR